jgi:hypothetical protein
MSAGPSFASGCCEFRVGRVPVLPASALERALAIFCDRPSIERHLNFTRQRSTQLPVVTTANVVSASVSSPAS